MDGLRDTFYNVTEGGSSALSTTKYPVEVKGVSCFSFVDGMLRVYPDIRATMLIIPS